MNNNVNETNYKPDYNNNNNGLIIHIITILIISLIILGTILFISINNKINDRNNHRYETGWVQDNNINSNSNNNNNSNNNYDVSMFKEVDINGFMDLYNGSFKSVIYIGRSTCGYCVKFLPSLQKAQEEFGYQTYYYDTDKLTDDDYDKITALNPFMKEYFTATPMVIVVENGQILSPNNDNTGWLGYDEYEVFKEYLIELGF